MYGERNYFWYRERRKRLARRRAALKRLFRTAAAMAVLLAATLLVSAALFAYDRLAGTGRTPVATAAEPARTFRFRTEPTETPQNTAGNVLGAYVPAVGTSGLKQAENWPVLEAVMTYTDTAAAHTETGATESLASIGMFEITAYCICLACTGIWSRYHPDNIGNPHFVQRTASGTVPQAGRTAAVDTDLIPLGTEIYIYGIGWRTAEDTGSAVTGYVVDLFKGCHGEALGFGRQTREVFVWERK